MSSGDDESPKSKRINKDKVLHTRIPAQLDHELRSNAGRLGLSVSTVVRNVLLNTFGLVEDVVNDSMGVARSLNPASEKQSKERPPAKPSAAVTVTDTPEILGWQEITLNMNALCHQCNGILPKGGKANIGIPVTASPVFMCNDCLSRLGTPSTVD